MEEYNIKKGYYYSKGDTWVHKEVDGAIRFGISDYAQKKLKSIIYLNLPEVGDSFQQDDSLGEVESKKSLSELICPVSGTVKTIHQEAVDEPGVLNRDPFGEGWILTLNCDCYQEDIKKLMDAAAYYDYIASREKK